MTGTERAGDPLLREDSPVEIGGAIASWLRDLR
jgi:hypothetical protein